MLHEQETAWHAEGLQVLLSYRILGCRYDHGLAIPTVTNISLLERSLLRGLIASLASSSCSSLLIERLFVVRVLPDPQNIVWLTVRLEFSMAIDFTWTMIRL